MKKFFISLTLLSIYLPSYAEPNPPEVIFDDVGGIIYQFNGNSLIYDQNYFALSGQQLTYDSTSTLSGCSVRTTPVTVNHASGQVEAAVISSIRWRGELQKPISFEPIPFMQINIDVLDEAGQIKKSYRDGIDSGFSDYNYKTYEDDNLVTLIYRTNGLKRFSVSQDMKVEQGDSVRLRICFVEPGISMTLDKINIHTFPVIQ